MKKILIVLAAAITIASCKEADKTADTTTSATATTTTEATSTATPTSTATTAPTVDPATLTKVEWLDGMDKDFGKIEEGKTLEVSFRFKNVGDKPLVISNVSASCGCTVPETPKKPYAPGETGVIKASFNSAGKSGAQAKQVNVFANLEPAMTTLNFRVEVKVKAKS